ncbi:MAG: protein phosphatase 2C domain-containing protein [Romboutsia sp.]|uniref:protein phosphatase 2C domain-containing protein n=1 Tax=Romboutsia sp. TaxID=1965302 RepID=UPI003F2D8F15
MDYKIFKGSATGYKNIVKNINSQDYLDYKFVKDSIICCVADGHSGEYFEFSHIGSKLACKAAIDTIEGIVDKNESEILAMLDDELIQKNIQELWMDMVNEDYRKDNPIVFKTQYLKYSTTLIVLLITKDFRLYLKLGDGNIVVKQQNEFKNVIPTKNHHIVDSLGRADSFKNIMYRIENNYVDSIILFTDGYENSFMDNDKLYKSLDSTINKYNGNIFSRLRLIKEYNLYLSKLSKSSSLDDISIIFII